LALKRDFRLDLAPDYDLGAGFGRYDLRIVVHLPRDPSPNEAVDCSRLCELCEMVSTAFFSSGEINTVVMHVKRVLLVSG
jgi:hypothetical protein